MIVDVLGMLVKHRVGWARREGPKKERTECLNHRICCREHSTCSSSNHWCESPSMDGRLLNEYRCCRTMNCRSSRVLSILGCIDWSNRVGLRPNGGAAIKAAMQSSTR